jgi:LCP family protein required for cell wall assembly
MSNKLNHSDSDDNTSNQKHIKNTDNENTCMFNANSDSLDTAEFKALVNRESSSSGSYSRQQVNPASVQQRQQYYRNQQGNYNPYGQQQYSRQNQQQQYNNNSGQYNQQYNRQDNGNSQYSNRYRNQNYSSQQNYGGGYYNNNNNNGNFNNRNRNYQQPYDDGYNQDYSSVDEPRTKKSKKKKSRRRNPLVKILLFILIILIFIFGVYSCTAIALISRMNHVDTGSRNHVAGALSESYVTSILLIGTDGRDISDSGRSDTMILASINSKTDEITLTSFMRDSYVEIPGYGSDKLNHAYAYGGPELLMDTIELNFNVCIDNYVMVNFTSFASIIDSVGGIEITVSDAEAEEINTILMAEVNEIMGDPTDSDLLSGGGTINLNGKQALSYARIRYVGNADFERTERQREVLSKVAGKLKSFSPSMIRTIASDAIPQISTNMSTSELYLLSLKLPFVLGNDIQQIQIPADGTYWSTTTDSGGDALGFDFDENYSILKEQVFGD